MKHLLLILGVIAVSNSGCTTMYFHNTGSDMRAEFSEWHHDGILRLVEFSPPVDLSERCSGKNWSTAKVSKDFVQWLAGSVTGGIYDPWGVEFSCK